MAAAKLALIGVGIGIVTALLLTRFLGSLLFEVKAADPLIFVVISLFLAVIAGRQLLPGAARDADRPDNRVPLRLSGQAGRPAERAGQKTDDLRNRRPLEDLVMAGGERQILDAAAS